MGNFCILSDLYLSAEWKFNNIFLSRQISRLTSFANYTKEDYLKEITNTSLRNNVEKAPVVWFNSHMPTVVRYCIDLICYNIILIAELLTSMLWFFCVWVYCPDYDLLTYINKSRSSPDTWYLWQEWLSCIYWQLQEVHHVSYM